jgi:hypothetical protein
LTLYVIKHLYLVDPTRIHYGHSAGNNAIDASERFIVDRIELFGCDWLDSVDLLGIQTINEWANELREKATTATADKGDTP